MRGGGETMRPPYCESDSSSKARYFKAVRIAFFIMN